MLLLLQNFSSLLFVTTIFFELVSEFSLSQLADRLLTDRPTVQSPGTRPPNYTCRRPGSLFLKNIFDRLLLSCEYWSDRFFSARLSEDFEDTFRINLRSRSESDSEWRVDAIADPSDSSRDEWRDNSSSSTSEIFSSPSIIGNPDSPFYWFSLVHSKLVIYWVHQLLIPGTL